MFYRGHIFRANQMHPAAFSNPSITRIGWFEAKMESCGMYRANPIAKRTPLHLGRVPEFHTADPDRIVPTPTSKSPTRMNQMAGPNLTSFATDSALGLF